MPKKKQAESVNPNPLLNSKERERAHSCRCLVCRGSFSPRDSNEEKAAPLCVGHTHFLSHSLNLHRNCESLLTINKQKKRVSQTALLNVESKSAHGSFFTSLLWRRTPGKTQPEVRKLEVSRLTHCVGSSCCRSSAWLFLSY